MKVAQIKFRNPEGTEVKALSYKLHEHSLAQKWQRVVENSQVTGARYHTADCFYGAGFTDLALLTKILFFELDKVEHELPELLEDPIFAPIKNRPFEVTQSNLNISHVLFERGIHELANVRKILFHYIYGHLYRLNTTIHQIEAELSEEEGFFIDTRLYESFRSKIKPEENCLFSLDRKWGELYLNYCHTGESYVSTMYNNYPSAPVPQTEIAGGMILQFQSDALFGDHTRLQEWMNKFVGQEVKLTDYPLGLIPLGSLMGDWTAESIREFFSKYSVLEGTIEFKNMD